MTHQSETRSTTPTDADHPPVGLPVERTPHGNWGSVAVTLVFLTATVWLATSTLQHRREEASVKPVDDRIVYSAPYPEYGKKLKHRFIDLYTMHPALAQWEGYEFDAEGARLDRHQVSVVGDSEFRRIWFFGNSAGQGLGMKVEETIPAQLNELFVAEGSAWRVVNLAHGGFTSSQDMLLLQELLVKGHRPDAVVVFNGITDHPPSQNGWLYESSLDAMIDQRRLLEAESSRLTRPFDQPWQDEALPLRNWLAGRGPLFTDPPPPPTGRRTYPEDETVWRECLQRYLVNLSVMKGVADQIDVPVLLVFQPVMQYEEQYGLREFSDHEREVLVPWMATNEFRRRETLYEARYADLREKLGPAFLDLYDVFRGHDGETLYDDPRHPGGAGNAIIARRLHAELSTRSLTGPGRLANAKR
jgi:lysophospholipase L1-like esterase